MSDQTGHSDSLTEGVRVRVAAQYLPDRSQPDQEQWVYAYRVQIKNESDDVVTLRRRRWLIRDAEGRLETVEGPGVVGEEPRLEPEESFEYVSGCPLPTRWGTMEGAYEMEREDGTSFHARIERFFLAPNVAPMAELDVK